MIISLFNQHFLLHSVGGLGNCLYDACSVAIQGNENLRHILRALTSIEMYKNARYYAYHPHFHMVWSKERLGKGSEHTSFIVGLSVASVKYFNTMECSREDCVRNEALRNSQDGT